MRRSFVLLFSVFVLSSLVVACEGGTDVPLGGGDAAATPDSSATGGGGDAGTCTPICDGRVCGSDGCGGTCAPGCGVTQVCDDLGQCVFPPPCTSDCVGKACGDDGCGGSCGTCGAGLACGADGQCVVGCQPSCVGRLCGDNGCGGSCGTCGAGSSCDAAGQCVAGCVPSCVGKTCGGDGCGGNCGTCGAGEACNALGKCDSTVCTPSCAGRQCGPDPSCGQSCGSCGDAALCVDGACQCQPDCAGRTCGDDGCGGTCGGDCTGGQVCNARGQCIDTGCQPNCGGVVCGPDPTCGQNCGGCTGGLTCLENQCVCVPSCVGVQCGGDGCGGTCGSCNAGLSCVEGVCACVPECGARECGSNGCGGSCGSCTVGETCDAAGQCQVGTTCTPNCAGRQCGSDGCGAMCGSCAAGQTCSPAGQCSGDTPPPAGIDSACASDADCGAGGTCLDFDFFPNGHCSVECSATECPAGSGCWNLGDQVGSYCLHTCATSAECRQGYYCDADSTCWPGEAPQPGTGLVGTPCTADADCDGATCYPEVSNGEPTGFTGGYCVIFDCSDQVPCPAGSECYEIQGGGTVCLDTCNTTAECRSGYACDSNACLPSCTAGSCPDGTVCNETSGQCEEEPCTSDADCANGLTCTGGRCVVDIGAGPGAGPGPTCANLPPLECTGTYAYCTEIVPFEPDAGVGYEDYPLNGESQANQYRSYLRRDVMMAVKYAAAKTSCKLGEWDFGLGGVASLGDMSESTGHVPGWGERPFYCWDANAANNGSQCQTNADCPTNLPYCHGQLGHPVGTHEQGSDMDIGYFQLAPSPDNKLRPICDHYTNGQEQYHCTAQPHLLDPWRTAFFIAALAEHPNIRVVGVDGQAGLIIDSALTQLCQDGWTSSVSNCANPSWYDFPVTYETTNGGAGWYYFHHHHFHISFSTPTNKSWLDGPPWCLTAECEDVSVLPLPQYDIQPTRRLPNLTKGGVRPL